MYPGQSAGDKKGKADLVEKLFGTRSWTAVENLSLERLQKARNELWIQVRGHAYGEGPPAPIADAPKENAPEAAA